MKDILVVTVCTTVRGYLPIYMRQLSGAGIEVSVNIVNDIENINAGGTTRWTMNTIREMCDKYGDYRRIIFTDAFDVMFFGTADQVISKVPDTGVLLGAERNCYPDPSLASAIPGETPWRFCNGGLLAGTPSEFHKWTRSLESQDYYDAMGLNQGVYNRSLARGDGIVKIDSRTDLFYCLFLETGEFVFDNGYPLNTLCGTRPNFVHGNGKWPMDWILEAQIQSLEGKTSL